MTIPLFFRNLVSLAEFSHKKRMFGGVPFANNQSTCTNQSHCGNVEEQSSGDAELPAEEGGLHACVYDDTKETQLCLAQSCPCPAYKWY